MFDEIEIPIWKAKEKIWIAFDYSWRVLSIRLHAFTTPIIVTHIDHWSCHGRSRYGQMWSISMRYGLCNRFSSRPHEKYYYLFMPNFISDTLFIIYLWKGYRFGCNWIGSRHAHFITIENVSAKHVHFGTSWLDFVRHSSGRNLRRCRKNVLIIIIIFSLSCWIGIYRCSRKSFCLDFSKLPSNVQNKSRSGPGH